MKASKYVSLITLLFLPGVIIFSGILTFTGCKKASTSVEFQGAQNPGFEEAGNTYYGFAAANWTTQYFGGLNYSCKRLGGTGSLPSKGSWYMEVGSSSGNSSGSFVITNETSQ